MPPSQRQGSLRARGASASIADEQQIDVLQQLQAMSLSLRTKARKSASGMTRQRTSVAAVTVAVRGRSLMSAMSPK